MVAEDVLGGVIEGGCCRLFGVGCYVAMLVARTKHKAAQRMIMDYGGFSYLIFLYGTLLSAIGHSAMRFKF